MKALISGLALVLAVTVFGAKKPETVAPPASGVRYRSSAEINFDSTEIKGDLGRPDLLVVTGNGTSDDNGMLRLRENFLDKLANDSAEEIQ